MEGYEKRSRQRTTCVALEGIRNRIKATPPRRSKFLDFFFNVKLVEVKFINVYIRFQLCKYYMHWPTLASLASFPTISLKL